MGALSYEHKRSVLEHLADPAHWVRHEIDLDWLQNPERRYKRTENGGVFTTHIAGNHIVMQDSKANGFIDMQRVGDMYEMHDETGKPVAFHRTGKSFEDEEKLGIEFSFFNEYKAFKKLEGRRLDLQDIGLSVLFQNNGGKQLFFHDSGGIAVFPPTSPDLRKPESSPFRRIHQRHMISFPMQNDDRPIDAAKLVIAFDLAVEPGLKTLNALTSINHWRRRNGELEMDSIQKHWNDSVEFTGNFVGVPKNFTVEMTDSGFDLYTTRDFRDWMAGHAQIVQAVTQTRALPAPTNQKKLRLADLATGELMSVDDQEWRYGAYETSGAPALAQNMRHAFADRLHMSGRDFVAVNYDEGRTVIAVNEQELQRSRMAYEATRDVMNAIERGLPVNVNALDFLREKFEQGADPKYYYYKNGAHTFADRMVLHGRRDMERALIELQGTHEFGVIQKRAPKRELLM